MVLYWIRVVFVSLEAAVLFLAALAWFFYKAEIEAVASSLSLSDEFLKYMFVAPVGIGLWVVNESRQLFQEDKESIRVLTTWPDYPRLKVHIWVGLLYGLVFSAISFVPWAAKSGVSSGAGLLLLVASIAGQFIVAASVYVARIKVRELLAHASAT